MECRNQEIKPDRRIKGSPDIKSSKYSGLNTMDLGWRSKVTHFQEHYI